MWCSLLPSPVWPLLIYWFMNLTFQVPMQYYSLQHQTLLPSPVPSTLGIVFALALSLHSFWSYLSTDLHQHIEHLLTWGDHLSMFFLSFCLFKLFMGFSRQEYQSSLPFPSPVDHILSKLSTMTHLSLVALYSMAHSFIELDKAVVHVIRFVIFLWLWFSVCLLSGEV